MDAIIGTYSGINNHLRRIYAAIGKMDLFIRHPIANERLRQVDGKWKLVQILWRENS